MAVQTQVGVYEKLGVKRIVNGAGTITRYGGSLMPPEVIAAMAEAARSFIDVDELYLRLPAAEDGDETSGRRHEEVPDRLLAGAVDRAGAGGRVEATPPR